MNSKSSKMLEFLKRIFKNEEGQSARKITEISLQNIEEWLNEKSKPLMEEIMQQAENVLMRVNEELERAKFNIEVLGNAKLQNPNIPFKAKQYMEGNRKAYIRAISSFIGHIEINNKDYFYLLDFCSQFDELLNDLNKGTFRSYTILQEFLANEAGNIAQNLKNIDARFKELKSVLGNEKIAAVNAAIEKIKSLKAKAGQKINLDVELKKIEAELKLADDEKSSLMAEIEKFNDSDEHKNFLKLNQEKESKSNNFYNDESIILQSFSVLEKPLRKYSHIAFEHEEIALGYLRQPIQTLLNDKFFKILEILKNLERLLNENKLKVDDKKREKSLEEIRKLDKKFLQLFLKKYYSFKSGMYELDSKISSSGVLEKLRKFGKQLDEINSSIEKSNKELGQLKNEISKAENNLSNLRSEIELNIKKNFGDNIRIKG